MMKKGSKAAIVCCSNGQSLANKNKMEQLKNTLDQLGMIPVFSDYIYEKILFSAGLQ